MSTQLTFFLLFLAIVALIGLGAWFVRRFQSNRHGSNANRGRMPRLAVIDATAVDSRRRLVLVRRDNIEHLLMIGGPSDIVIEPNIVRAAPQRDQAPQRGPVGAELPPRVAPLPDAAHWADTASDTPDYLDPVLPELPPRPNRPSFADEVRRPSPAISERRTADPLAGLAPEPMLRPEPRTEPRSEPPARPRPMPRSESLTPRSESSAPRSEPLLPRGEPLAPRSEPLIARGEPLISRAEPLMPRSSSPSIEPVAKAPPARTPERPVAPTPSAISAADQNLAEMAQRLEAALRRPSDPTANDRAPPVVPESPSRPVPQRAASEIAVNPPHSEPAPPLSAKVSFENLEDEMASLLGRPKTPT
jgi:flagellar protein FliO/FliZ